MNLNQLENLVLVMFANDTMVVPRESSHFGFYAEGQDQTVVPLQETRIYTEVIYTAGGAAIARWSNTGGAGSALVVARRHSGSSVVRGAQGPRGSYPVNYPPPPTPTQVSFGLILIRRYFQVGKNV